MPSIEEICVDRSQNQSFSCDKDDIGREESDRSVVSSTLDFLSLDQKLILAQRTSMGSHPHQPGAYYQSEDGILPMTNTKLSQEKMWKKHAKRPSLSCVHDNDEENRKPPPMDDGPQLSLTEIKSLDEIHDRMNNFRQELESEIQSQDVDQRHYEEKLRMRPLLGICLSTLVIVFLTSIAIPLAIQNADGKNNVLHNSGDSAYVSECQSRSSFDREKYNAIRSFLISYFPKITNSIDTYRESANVALCWLSQYDKLILNPLAGDGNILAQRFALVLLCFRFLGFQNVTIRGSHVVTIRDWLSEKDVCDWNHVECDMNKIGFRCNTSLSFSNLRLQNVQIPSEIALLRDLRKLTWDSNTFIGTVPSELGTLTHLEEFSGTLLGSMDGDVLGGIIEQWSQLQRLNLEMPFSNNLPQFRTLEKLTQLKVTDPSQLTTHLFPGLQKLTRLEVLSLHLRLIGTFPSYLWKFSKLEALSIILSQGIISEDITSLSKLKFLRLLDISGSLPSSIGSLSNLTTLVVASPTEQGSLPSEIGELSKLELLQIDYLNLILPVPEEICFLSKKDKIDVTITSNCLGIDSCSCS